MMQYASVLPEVRTMRKPAPWADALQRQRKRAGFSQEELALEADLSQATISQIERGVKLPTTLRMDRFSRYLEALRLSPTKFEKLTGLTVDIRAPAELTELGSDYLSDVRAIPLIDAISAGPGYDDGEQVGEIYIPRDWSGDYAAYRVDGNSMEPDIGSGDIIIAKVQTHAEYGDTVVAYCPGMGMVVKRLQIEDENVRRAVLSSNNKDFASVFFSEDCHIVGRVVETRRRL